MIMDANGMMDLAQLQLDVDYNDPPYAEHSLNHFMDLISKDRTVVIPRAVYRELQSTHTGWRDIIRDSETGALMPDIGKHYSEFRYADSLLIHNLFADYWQNGKLRIYENMDAMEEAGELDEMKGGIVIVDLPNRHGEYWPIKEKPYFSHQKNAIATTPNGEKIDFSALPKNERPQGKQGLGRGDNGIMELAIKLRMYAREGKLDTRYALFTNDMGLGKRLTGLYKNNPKAKGQRFPIRLQTLDFIWGLHKTYPNEFPQELAEAYTNAFQREFQENYGRDYEISDRTLAHIHRASDWMHDTKAQEVHLNIDAADAEHAGRLKETERQVS